ncbi:SusD/RagB family nutrient-binding outer membrane lipoprotein [Mucilaginibacter polytrichastri]|uniref:SusD/RagB family nutrient-binding outer membrane lipoprotein n=1 Tax=Mucilaginibacter polytrichastri TaxID=1302689 RepID=A0A1Q5ZVM8_9SPHI|nr:SusD/RagB family nutrient-binding outer membrane lipoprotein [Mucilaginibacter polytrichastri]OKS85758.1 hypothetical protein RG47T_1204 [Mucilaginibacter polytrichastri]SFS61660.1 Starch-binding associating with outer membrane [Mucilaginibacter polytrichastri]
MKINKLLTCIGFIALGTFVQSCNKFVDVNTNPSTLTDVSIPQLLPSITVNVGYMGGSDLFRYGGLMVQQFSGQTTNASTTFREYERYNINNSDVNNAWSNIYSTTLADITQLITKADAGGSPHYSGVAKLLKAYVYQLTVDAWGDVPYTEAAQFSILYPHYDDDAVIYTNLIKLIDEGLGNINAATSTLEPNANTTIFATSSWATSKVLWTKFANTLKLRIFLHYSQKDAAFAGAQITALINSGAQFMTSNADDFQMPYTSTSGNQNPISTIEGGQFKNSFFPNRTIVNMMNATADPRRPSYFVPFPYNSNPATYKGASVLDPNSSVAYSRLNTYLKGTATVGSVVQNTDGSITDASITWAGNAPARLMTYAEYNFIRAEAALTMGAPGDAQTFYQAGITASMNEAGVSTANANTYLAANGTLTGTTAQKLEKIITEKFVANFGTVMEPWTDWRRTGYPSAVVPLPISVAVYDQIPRSLFYPLSETSNNPNAKQKASMLDRVFWDVRP